MIKRLLVLCSSLALAASVGAGVEVYKIDPVHSSAGFTIRHIMTKFSSSFTSVNGKITVDRDHLENSQVEATIDVTALNTANEHRDDDLKGPNYFNTAKFPMMSFKSKSWKKTGENTFDITGDLTIRDVTKEVVLHATLDGFGPGMRPGTQLSSWEATTVLNRSEFGVTGPAMIGKAIGEEVTVNISVEADEAKS
ncbi:MAG TPA: YceI family protein [Candidatus Didemnitutus sp.]|nr:YceI family protein [Candidatus Didemnitutus sp.]